MRYHQNLRCAMLPDCIVILPCLQRGERGGSVVECRVPEREVGGSIPTAAVLCPWARHFTPRKYWLITQEAVAPSRHDWKIVDWDVKPQHKQTNCLQRRPFVEKAVDSLIKFPHFICMKQDTLVHLISQTVSMNYKTRESNGILSSL